MRYVSALAVVLVGTAASAETVAVDATIAVTDRSEIIQLSDQEMMMVFAADEVISAPDQPLDGAEGGCHGTAVALAGAFEGGGHCVYTVSGGDKVVIRWTATGQGQGTWEAMGGTGIFAGATGGGDFASSGEGETKVTGEMMMP